MSWSDAKKARAESEFFRLKDDGDEATIIIAGEPRVVKRQGMKGGETTRFYIPIIHKGVLKTWDVGGQMLDKIASIPKGGLGERFTVTRRGKANDTNTTYDVIAKPLSAEDADRLARSGLLAKAGGLPSDAGADTGDDTIPF